MKIFTAILSLSLIHEGQLSVLAKECALSTGKLPKGGLPRNSEDRLTDHTRNDLKKCRKCLYGDVSRGIKANIRNFQAVRKFIEKTNRFS